MNGDKFSTPTNVPRFNASSSRTTATKRDSLQAELERDPQLSTAKRQQRSQALTSHMAHASLERQLMTAQTTKTELESKLREKDILIERLERDRRWLAEREKEEREEKERERAESDEEKRKADSELRALRSALTALREQHADLEDAHSSLSRSSSQTIASQNSQISTLTRQVDILQDECEEFKQIAEERSCTIQNVQDQFDELNATQDNISRKTSEEESWVVVREELHRQADYLRKLEGTNAKLNAELSVLRERNTSVEVLKEEKRGLERKVAALEEYRGKAVRLEAEVEASRREREEWASKTSETSTPSKTPVSVTQSLSTLRLTHARLLEDHGANVALLRTREAELADAERRHTEARAQVETSQAESQALKEKVQRREHRATLAEREVGFLQALVASFSAEEASLDSPVVDEAKAQRLQELEALLEEYKKANHALENEIDALGEDPATLGHGRTRKDLSAEAEAERTAKLDAQKALEEAAAESEKHLEKIDELEQSLFELQGEIGAGRHVPPGVRILCLKDNPAQQWADLSQAAMDQLKGENEALIKRLKELEESGARGTADHQAEGHGEELVPRESWEIVSKEKNDLEEVVKQKEKRLLRLQQVFTAKSAEFREAIASILGLKLAFYPNGQVRVTSLYDLSASFVFQPTSKAAAAEGEGMKMQLVAQGEGGPQDLPQMMRYWVEEEQCIPGFLASVTLECYDKLKREQADGIVI